MESVLCETCGSLGLKKGADGFHYCITCGTQSQNFLDEDLADFQALGQDESGRRTFAIARQYNVERQQQEARLKEINDRLKGVSTLPDDQDDPEAAKAQEEELLRILTQRPEEAEELMQARNTLASKFGSVENVQVWGLAEMYDPSELSERLATHVRDTYVESLQKIVQMQCEALVEVHGVSPVICGLVGPLWLRFIASTRVFEKGWADEAILLADEENLKLADELEPVELDDAPVEKIAGDTEPKKRKRNRAKVVKVDIVPVTKTKAKVTGIWMTSLQNRIPLSATLSILFLACYIAREAIMPTDITCWATSGTLPYLTAYTKLQPIRFFGPERGLIQIPELEPKRAFRPKFMINARVLEFLAGAIATRLGLELPPVNFHGLSQRMLEELGVADEGIATYLERMYEWYTPEGLWLSGRRFSFPTRAYVAAMVIVTIKLVYGVNGHADSSLYWPSVAKRLRPKHPCGRAKFQRILDLIEKRLFKDELNQQVDLKDYLSFCQEVIYPPCSLPVDEQSIYDHLWELYDKKEEVAEVKALKQKEEDDIQAESGEKMDSEHESEEEEEEEYSIGSAEWSRTPSQQKKPPTKPPGEKTDSDQMAAQQPKPAAFSRQQEGSSADQQCQPLQEAKSRLLKALVYELRNGNFRLLKGKSVVASDDNPYTYQRYAIQRLSRAYKKVVHADYFILLFACSRIARIRCNIIHKCVQLIEADLWSLERRLAYYTVHGLEEDSVGIDEGEDSGKDSGEMDEEEILEQEEEIPSDGG